MVIASQRKAKQVNVNLSLTSIIWTLGRVFLTSLLGGKAPPPTSQTDNFHVII